MLELTVEQYQNNLYYKSQNAVFYDLAGNDFYILEIEKVGVNFLVTYEDYDYNVKFSYLGGHEKLYIDYETEVLEDDL